MLGFWFTPECLPFAVLVDQETLLFPMFELEEHVLLTDTESDFSFFDVVRPRTAGLLIGIECSRVRDNSWMYLISFVTTLIGVILAAVQGNYPIVL